MRRRTVFAATALAGTATLLAGCGSSSSGGSTGSGSNKSSVAPAAELVDSVSALGSASALTVTLSLGASASQITAQAVRQHEKLTSSQAAAISGAHITISATAPSGQTLGSLSSTGSGSTQITLSSGTTNYLTIRSVNKTLYVQTDLKDGFALFGKSSTFNSLKSATAQLPEKFIQALIGGQWVSLPSSTLSSLSGATGGSSGSPNTAQAEKLINGLKTLLSKDVHAVRTSSGSTDQLTLTANTRTLVTDFEHLALSSLPSSAGSLLGSQSGKIPSKSITLTAAVTGGALSSLSMNLGQFGANAPDFPVQLTFARSAPSISAPTGATAVDLSQLEQLIGSVAGGA